MFFTRVTRKCASLLDTVRSGSCDWLTVKNDPELWGSVLGRPSPAGGRLKDCPKRRITPSGVNRGIAGLIKNIPIDMFI